MTFEEFETRGWHYADYTQLSQWQRLRGLILRWRRSQAPDKGISVAALWDASDEESDWQRVDDWWRPRHWRFGIDQCQNFDRINLGPIVILVAV